MFIISPKWIYFSNRRIESGKSLLINGSVIADILTDNKIQKKYKETPRIYYKDHLMMPTFSECFLDINDCISQEMYTDKLNSLFSNGVSKVQIVSDNYENFLKYDKPSNMNISYKITLNGSKCGFHDVKKILKTLDFYKSDPTKLFSINLINVNKFKKDLLTKIASICSELNLSIDIHLSEICELSNEHIKNIFDFWDEINLTNNFTVHNFLQSNDFVQKHINKFNTNIFIKYSDLHDTENMKFLLSLIKNKYKCVLISECENTYKFYDVLKCMNLLIDRDGTFDKHSIINSVTSDTSQFFNETSVSESIDKGSLASFNLFNIRSKRLLVNDNYFPLLSDLDNTSLTNVWSSGEAITIGNE